MLCQKKTLEYKTIGSKKYQGWKIFHVKNSRSKKGKCEKMFWSKKNCLSQKEEKRTIGVWTNILYDLKEMVLEIYQDFFCQN